MSTAQVIDVINQFRMQFARDPQVIHVLGGPYIEPYWAGDSVYVHESDLIPTEFNGIRVV